MKNSIINKIEQFPILGLDLFCSEIILVVLLSLSNYRRDLYVAFKVKRFWIVWLKYFSEIISEQLGVNLCKSRHDLTLWESALDWVKSEAGLKTVKTPVAAGDVVDGDWVLPGLTNGVDPNASASCKSYNKRLTCSFVSKRKIYDQG